MPKYKSANDLPKPVLRILTENNKQKVADYSVTQLIKPPRILALEQRHDEQLLLDPYDNVWKMFGHLMHGKIEGGAEGAHMLAEHTCVAEIDGVTLSGTFDLLEMNDDGDTLWDMKFSTVYKAIAGIGLEWEAQVNIYRWLIANSNLKREVKNQKILLIMRDWQKRKAEQDAAYPPKGIAVIEVQRWRDKETEDYIRERIGFHQSAKQQADSDLPVCTNAERWASGEAYAVMPSAKAKRAVSGGLFHVADYMGDRAFALEEATKKASEIGGVIEHRPPEYKRCQNYCDVAAFCNVWQQHLTNNDKTHFSEASDGERRIK